MIIAASLSRLLLLKDRRYESSLPLTFAGCTPEENEAAPHFENRERTILLLSNWYCKQTLTWMLLRLTAGKHSLFTSENDLNTTVVLFVHTAQILTRIKLNAASSLASPREPTISTWANVNYEQEAEGSQLIQPIDKKKEFWSFIHSQCRWWSCITQARLAPGERKNRVRCGRGWLKLKDIMIYFY